MFHAVSATGTPLLCDLQGIPGRLLLRFLLRRPLAAGVVGTDPHFDDEAFVMIGPFFGDDVVLGEWQAAPLGQFLECGLVVMEEEVVFLEVGEIAIERPLDELPRRVDAAVEEDRRDGGLAEGGQERVLLPSSGLLLADAEEGDIAHTELASLRRQRLAAAETPIHPG